MIRLYGQRGFTLIEVMVALVVLAIGLLGMATLMMQSMQSSESAYSRSQATILAYDILERMRANKVASTDARISFNVPLASQNSAYVYSYSASGNCPAGGNASATGTPKATADLASWCQQIRATLPSVQTASIARPGSGTRYLIVVSWQDPGDEVGEVRVEAEL
nr:type IV pilus modification protein PilV [Pseudomonas oleovorans]